MPFRDRVVVDGTDKFAWLRARSRGVTATDAARLSSQKAVKAVALEKLLGSRFRGNSYTEHGLHARAAHRALGELGLRHAAQRGAVPRRRQSRPPRDARRPARAGRHPGALRDQDHGDQVARHPAALPAAGLVAAVRARCRAHARRLGASRGLRPRARRPRVPLGRPGRERDPPARRPRRGPARGRSSASTSPNTRIQASPMVVATSSRRLPNSAFQSKQRHEPAGAGDHGDADARDQREDRRSARCPTANAHCRIVQHAAANAMTALVVWMKSGQVNSGPYGTGHPAVQVTCDAMRKNPHETNSDSDGRQRFRMRGRDRMSRPTQPIATPPTTMSTSASWNHLRRRLALRPELAHVEVARDGEPRRPDDDEGGEHREQSGERERTGEAGHRRGYFAADRGQRSRWRRHLDHERADAADDPGDQHQVERDGDVAFRRDVRVHEGVRVPVVVAGDGVEASAGRGSACRRPRPAGRSR